MDKGTVVIGNGIAGITTARHLRKNSNMRIRVISIESPYFFSRTALMYIYMGHMKFYHTKPYEDWFWEKNRIELIQAKVLKVYPDEKYLSLDTGERLHFDKLVIATGSRPAFRGWPGENLEGVQGLVSLQDLETLEKWTPAPHEKNHGFKAVIVGGGLIGVELAEMLRTREVDVTMLVRENHFWGGVLTANEGKLINAEIESHGVHLNLNTELDSMLGEGNRVEAVRTKQGQKLACNLVGLSTGVVPNIEFLEGSGIEVGKGILVDEFLQTNFNDIYAAGDCAEMRNTREGRKPLEAVWYVGRMMGEALGHTLAGTPTAYLPGPWFNSAKFFDIEYQTYGNISPKEGKGEKHFFFKYNDRKFLTMAYHPETETFLGLNAFGIRLRHQYFHEALACRSKIGEVVAGLDKANFDGEFEPKWYRKMKTSFFEETGIKPAKPSFLQNLFLR